MSHSTVAPSLSKLFFDHWKDFFFGLFHEPGFERGGGFRFSQMRNVSDAVEAELIKGVMWFVCGGTIELDILTESGQFLLPSTITY